MLQINFATQRVTSPAMGPFTSHRAHLRSTRCQARKSSQVVVKAQSSTNETATLTRLPHWDKIWESLSQQNIPSIQPIDAHALLKDGKAVLIDVRPDEEFEKAHPIGALHAPAFRIIKPTNAGNFSSLLKWAVMTSQGVTATQIVEEFPEKVASLVPAGKIAIIMCESGGSLDSSPQFKTGRQSRSLTAAFRLLDSGKLSADCVVHLKGGALGWDLSRLPFNGEYDRSVAFKSPNAIEVMASYGEQQ